MFPRRRAIDQRGAAKRPCSGAEGIETLEAAFVVPIMLLVSMMIVQFGTLVYARQMAEEAARFGVRQGVVNVGNPAGGAVAAASQYAAGALPWGAHVDVEAPGGIVGSTLRIRVTTVPPNLLGPILTFFGGGTGPFKVTAIAEGRMEGWQP